MTTTEFIRRANIIHDDKYSYDNVVYVNAHTNINITCPIHGEWVQKPMGHLTGNGCPQCGNIKKGLSKSNSSFLKFIEHSNVKHGGKYTYLQETYLGMKLPMTIICPIHGGFEQTPDVHKRAGCPRCGSGPVSKSSQKWLDSLGVDKSFREIWLTIDGKRIKVDGFDPHTNTVYEYWGDYWHGNPKVYDLNESNSNNKIKFGELYQQTLNRIELIKSSGYNLIQIWEDEWLLISVNNSTLC